MKKIIIPIICLCLLLTGCGVHWSYSTTIKAIDNDYFKTKVIHEDSECMIIENEVTGEYFLIIANGYEVTITPIQMNEMNGHIIEYEYGILYNEENEGN